MNITKEYKELTELLTDCNEMTTSIKTTYDFNNTWIRRYFRLYLDGSYTCYADYKNNCISILKANNSKSKVNKLRAFIEPKFIAFIMLEFKMSEYQVRKAIFEAFNYSKENKTELELFNCHLIEDALEMAISSEMEVN